ncbi:MAG TPA: hypothetical protein VNI77_12490 [Nitrososphaera sp.]|nr:hypothetical protein [Nitrososphaera sp.]
MSSRVAGLQPPFSQKVEGIKREQGACSGTSTDSTTAISYWDNDAPSTSTRRDLAEQLLIHSQSHRPACDCAGFGSGSAGSSSIKHPDCFWCCVGAHLDCDYDFLQKIPKQKLDEIASFACAFFRCDCHYYYYYYCYYLPDSPETTDGVKKEKR